MIPTRASPRPSLRRGEAVWGGTPGLRQHGQTSRIVPEIDCRWHFVDPHATQQARRAGAVPTHLPQCRPGEQRCARVGTLATSGLGEAYLNAQDPVVKLCYRMHGGTHPNLPPERAHRCRPVPCGGADWGPPQSRRFRLCWRFLPTLAVSPQVAIRPGPVFLPQRVPSGALPSQSGSLS